MTVFVLAGMLAAPFIGVTVERHPLRRSWVVLGVVTVTVIAWTLVLAWPGTAPVWVLVLLVLAMALGGPGSLIAFDFARTFNPPNRLGTATGIVNVGGFVAALITMLLVGVVLDIRGADAVRGYDLNDFRVAFSTQYLVWAVGVVGIVLTRRKVRARLAREGVVVPPLRAAIARNRANRR
jgi:MFS family permease